MSADQDLSAALQALERAPRDPEAWRAVLQAEARRGRPAAGLARVLGAVAPDLPADLVEVLHDFSHLDGDPRLAWMRPPSRVALDPSSPRLAVAVPGLGVELLTMADEPGAPPRARRLVEPATEVAVLGFLPTGTLQVTGVDAAGGRVERWRVHPVPGQPDEVAWLDGRPGIQAWGMDSEGAVLVVGEGVAGFLGGEAPRWIDLAGPETGWRPGVRVRMAQVDPHGHAGVVAWEEPSHRSDGRWRRCGQTLLLRRPGTAQRLEVPDPAFGLRFTPTELRTCYEDPLYDPPDMRAEPARNFVDRVRTSDGRPLARQTIYGEDQVGVRDRVARPRARWDGRVDRGSSRAPVASRRIEGDLWRVRVDVEGHAVWTQPGDAAARPPTPGRVRQVLPCGPAGALVGTATELRWIRLDGPGTRRVAQARASRRRVDWRARATQDGAWLALDPAEQEPGGPDEALALGLLHVASGEVHRVPAPRVPRRIVRGVTLDPRGRWVVVEVPDRQRLVLVPDRPLGEGPPTELTPSAWIPTLGSVARFTLGVLPLAGDAPEACVHTHDRMQLVRFSVRPPDLEAGLAPSWSRLRSQLPVAEVQGPDATWSFPFHQRAGDATILDRFAHPRRGLLGLTPTGLVRWVEDEDRPQPVGPRRAQVECAALSRDGDRLALGAAGGLEVVALPPDLADTRAWQVIRREPSLAPSALAFTEGGASLVVGCGSLVRRLELG